MLTQAIKENRGSRNRGETQSTVVAQERKRTRAGEERKESDSIFRTIMERVKMKHMFTKSDMVVIAGINVHVQNNYLERSSEQ